MKYEIDFYKEFELEMTDVAGLVNKITSPKGIRKQEESGYTSYHLRTDLIGVYDYRELNKPFIVEPGIYWVMDLCHINEKLTWLHYLFIVEDDGTVYPVYEFIDAHDSKWVKKSLPIIKGYFAGEDLEPIALTRFKHKTKEKSRWATVGR